VEVVASLSRGRTAAAQCGLFTHKSVPVIFEPPCNFEYKIRFDFSTTLSETFHSVRKSQQDIIINLHMDSIQESITLVRY